MIILACENNYSLYFYQTKWFIDEHGNDLNDCLRIVHSNDIYTFNGLYNDKKNHWAS